MVSLVKDPPSNAGDAGSIPDQGNNIPRAAIETQHGKKQEEEKEETPAGD